MSTSERRRRPAALWGLVAVLVFQALGGLAGGIALAAAPDGSILQMPVTYLDGSPFQDYLVPGLILLTVLGIAPLVAAVLLVVRPRPGWFVAFAVGCALLIWLLVEIAVIPLDPLQVVYGLVGAAIVVLSLLRPVRAHCDMLLLG